MTCARIHPAARRLLFGLAALLLMVGSSPAQALKRTRAEVEDLIKDAGAKPPDWWDQAALNYPDTLDLSWPDKPPGGWDNKKNVGQFLWDIINPNPGRWREGVKFLHHVMTVNAKNPAVVRKAQNSLGMLYAECLEDFPRAAFWWRKSGNAVGLANCYWRMGNKDMAVAELGKVNFVTTGTIQLWSAMGNLSKALTMAEAMAKAVPDIGYLAAGDALRLNGQYAKAIAEYEKVGALTKGSGHLQKNKARALSAIEAVKLFDGLNLAKVADGTYSAESMGYEAPVKVDVTVKAGKIETVKVTDHHEKQFYSSLTDVPARIIAKQSVKGVDATSGATITSDAIINASAKALGQGQK